MLVIDFYQMQEKAEEFCAVKFFFETCVKYRILKQQCPLAAENKNQGIINFRHCSLVCEKQSEVYCFVHFVIKFASICGRRKLSLCLTKYHAMKTYLSFN
jgi:hypothetical protein